VKVKCRKRPAGRAGTDAGQHTAAVLAGAVGFDADACSRCGRAKCDRMRRPSLCEKNPLQHCVRPLVAMSYVGAKVRQPVVADGCLRGQCRGLDTFVPSPSRTDTSSRFPDHQHADGRIDRKSAWIENLGIDRSQHRGSPVAWLMLNTATGFPDGGKFLPWASDQSRWPVCRVTTKNRPFGWCGWPTIGSGRKLPVLFRV